MGRTKQLLIEDWERLSLLDKIYIEEESNNLYKELEEFLSLQKGIIVVDKSKETKEAKETLPF